MKGEESNWTLVQVVAIPWAFIPETSANPRYKIRWSRKPEFMYLVCIIIASPPYQENLAECLYHSCSH